MFKDVMIKKDTLERLSNGFKNSRNLTIDITTEDMINYAAEPVDSNLNRLAQLFVDIPMMLTKKDLEGVVELRDCCFQGCTSIRTVEFPETLTKIGKYAFYDCRGIKEIHIPNTVTEIGDYAFQYCTEMEVFTLPDTPITLGNNITRGCHRLQEFRLPEGYTHLPNAMLHQGTGYASKTGVFNVYLPSTLTSVGTSQFGKVVTNDDADLPPSGAKADVNIYFANQQGLDAWYETIYTKYETGKPDGKLRFYVNGERVTHITVPSTVTTIKSDSYPSGLDVNVVCEGNITSINGASCYGVKSISFPNNTKVPTLDKNSWTPNFDVNILEKIEVPASLYDSWIIATNWAEWADYIVVI